MDTTHANEKTGNVTAFPRLRSSDGKGNETDPRIKAEKEEQYDRLLQEQMISEGCPNYDEK
jgi:hypothetical protein